MEYKISEPEVVKNGEEHNTEDANVTPSTNMTQFTNITPSNFSNLKDWFNTEVKEEIRTTIRTEIEKQMEKKFENSDNSILDLWPSDMNKLLYQEMKKVDADQNAVKTCEIIDLHNLSKKLVSTREAVIDFTNTMTNRLDEMQVSF